MNRCPPVDELERLVADQLAAAERKRLEEHINSCDRCQERVAGLTGPTQPDPNFPYRVKQAPADEQQDATSLSSATSVVGEPPLLAGYEILGVLGRGGMGIVYQARQTKLNRLVALKMILAGGQAGSEQLARFLAEAEAVARLQHPNIVQIHEVGEWRSTTGGPPLPFFALEYVEGGSLDKQLGGTPQPPRRAAQLAELLARAMHAAHQRGIVHRDLKPANVLLALDGTPKITDFGLAKRLDDDSGQTRSGAILGTPSYMAPEQAAGQTRQIGPAADIYALGAMLYEFMTGRPPFKAASQLETILQVTYEEPIPPRRLQAAIPVDLETICLKCLQKDPGKRYATAAELANDLRRFLNSEPIEARPVGAVGRFWRWCRRNPRVAFLTGLVILTLLAGVTGVVWQWRQAVANALVADEQRREALKQAKLAQEQSEKVRRQSYLTTLNLAWQRWHEGQVETVLRLLNSQRPGADQEDLRGFEWHCLWGLCHGERLALRHSSPVRALAISPDGHTLASCCDDRIVRLWDIVSGQELRALHGHRVSIRALAFSPDGRRLVSGGHRLPDSGDEPGEIKMWDVATGQECVSFADGIGQVSALAISPDGRQVAAASRFPIGVQLYDTVTGKAQATLQGHTDQVISVAYSADGHTLASGSWDETVRLWDVAKRQEQLILRGSRGKVLALAFTPDGKTVAGSGSQSLCLWDVASGKQLPSLEHAGGVWAAAFARQGKLLAVAHGLESGPFEVQLWDRETYGQVALIKGHTDVVLALAFTGDGQTLVTGSRDGTIKVWDVGRWQAGRVSLGHTGAVHALAYSPDGRTLAIGGSDQSLGLWNPTDGTERVRIRGEGVIQALCFSPDGKVLAVARQGGLIQLVEVASGRQQAQLLQNPATVTAIKFSPDGRTLAAGSLGVIHLWDPEQRQLLTSWNAHRTWIRGLAFLPDGKQLATGSDDRTVRLWDVATGSEAAVFEGHTDVVSALCCTPDGKSLISASWDGTLKLWDLARRQVVQTYRGHAGLIRAATLSPDGKVLASASNDHTVKLWEVGTGREQSTFDAHPAAVSAVAFAPDGQMLASAGVAGPVCLWEAATGRERFRLGEANTPALAFSPDGKSLAVADRLSVKLLDPATRETRATLNGHTSWVRALAFSPDGRLLASGAGWLHGRPGGEVTIWDAARGLERTRLPAQATVVHTVAFSPDSRFLAVGGGQLGYGETVQLWDVSAGRARSLTGVTAPVYALAFSADGRTLAAGAWSAGYTARGEILLWDTQQLDRPPTVLQGHRGKVHALAYPPGGRLLASGSEDGSVRLWDMGTQQLTAVLQGHRSDITSLTFGPLGKRLASGSWDGTLKIWDPATAQELATLTGHEGPIQALAFSPDGRTLATGCFTGYYGSGGLVLWHAANDE